MEEKVIGENNCDRSESTLVSKSGRSLIESRSMELVNANEKQEVGLCGHFSIRGYVAEIRRKDSKICWPFPTVNNHKDLEEQTDVLPPLSVAEFRWWRCQKCLKRTDTIGAATEIGVLANCYNNGFKSSITCSHGNSIMSSHGDARKLLSGFQPASKEHIFEGRKASAGASVNVNDNEYYLSLCSDKKEKEAALVHPMREDICTFKSRDDSAEENVNQATYGTICDAKKVKTCLTGERVTQEAGKFKISFETDKRGCKLSACETPIASQSVCHDKNASETLNLKSKGDGLIDCSKKNNGSREVSNVVFNIRNLKCTSNSSTEIQHKENPGFSRNNLVKMNKQHGKVMADHGMCEVVDGVIHKNAALNAVTSHTSKFHSMELDESEYDLSENDENLLGSNIFDQHHVSLHDNSGGTLQRRKTRKVRLLTDIIKSEALSTSGKDCHSNRDTKIDHIKTESAHSKAARDASIGIGLHPGPESQVAVQGNDRKVILGKKMKRNMPQDGDEGPSLISWPKGAPEKVRLLKGDAETKDIDPSIVNSEAEADASVRIGLDPCFNSYLTNHRYDKKLILGKKKNKMPRIEEEQSSLMNWQEGMSGELQIIRRNVEIEFTGTETVPSTSERDAFTGKCQHPRLKSFVGAQRNDRDFILGKKKSKKSQLEDGKSLMPWQEGTSRKDQVIRRDVEIKHKSVGTIPLKSARDAFTGGGMHHGLKDLMATHKKAKRNNMLQVEGGGNIPRVEGGGSSLIFQPKVSSGTCNYGNSTVVQGHPKDSNNQCDERANNMCEQATLDDIPMEIVELMAKNQHERLLFSAEGTTGNSYCLSGTTEKVKDTDKMDFTEVLGNEMLRLLLEKNSHMQKAQSSNEVSAVCATGKRTVPTEQKSDGYPSQVSSKYNNIHFNVSQQEKSNASVGYATFSQCQEKLSSGVQFPVSGPSSNSGTQNFSWNGDMVGHSCSLTCLQSLEGYHTSQTVSRQSSCREDHHVWSSMIPNCMPFGINNPKKFVTESCNKNTLSQWPEPSPKGNMSGHQGLKSMNTNAIHLQKLKGNFESETKKRTHPEFPFACTERGNEYHPKKMGPLDLYTNETIPAMHLLRLMDAGACSSKPVNLEENQKFTRQPPFPHDRHHKESSGLKVEQSKNSEALMCPPSSDSFDKNCHMGKSVEHFPPLSKVNTYASSVQKDANFRRATGFISRLPDVLTSHSLKSQGKEKTKSSQPPTEPRGPRSHRSASRDGSSGKNHESVSVHDPQKAFMSASNSIPFPLHSRAMENSTTCVELEVNKKDGTIWSAKCSLGTEICTLNRNPADFSVPEAGNAYMIGAGDIKYRKIISSGDRSGLTNPDGHKRQRMMKLTAIQEHVRH